jgi:hypothetical protein
MSVVSATCYELLGVPVHAPRTEVARAWHDRRREALEGRRERSTEQAEALCARLDDAYRTLVEPQRARRYQLYVEQQRSAPTLQIPGDSDEQAEDPLRTPIERPWEQREPEKLAEVIDAVLQSSSHELPEEDTINTLDEWGTGEELRRTVSAAPPMRPAVPVARPPSLPSTVTGRHRVIARHRPRTAPSARIVPPWSKKLD